MSLVLPLFILASLSSSCGGSAGKVDVAATPLALVEAIEANDMTTPLPPASNGVPLLVYELEQGGAPLVVVIGLDEEDDFVPSEAVEGVPSSPCADDPLAALTVASYLPGEGGSLEAGISITITDLVCQLDVDQVEASDVDGDGHLELAVSYGWVYDDYAACESEHLAVIDLATGQLQLHVETAHVNTFEEYSGQLRREVAFGDTDGDGHVDVVLTDTSWSGLCETGDDGLPVPPTEEVGDDPDEGSDMACEVSKTTQTFLYTSATDKWIPLAK